MEEALYLDTSAVNWLHHQEAQGKSTASYIGRARVFISVFTFAELASTHDRARGLSLLEFAKHLSGTTRPLALPGNLLKRARVAIGQGKAEMNNSISSEWDGLWNAFLEPSLLEEEDYIEIQNWRKKQHEWFETMHTNGRRGVQEFLAQSQNSRPREFTHYSKFIHLLSSKEHVLLDLISGLAPSESPMAEEEARNIAQYSEHWRFVLAAFGYSILCRGFKTHNHGKDSSPGSIDVQQAIYLATCDRFVTADKDQFNMIRQIIPFGHKERHAAYLGQN